MSDNILKAVDEVHIVEELYIDTLSYSALLEKLKSFGITGDSNTWFTDYRFNAKKFCKVVSQNF